MWVKMRFSERQIFSRQAAKIAKEAKEAKEIKAADPKNYLFQDTPFMQAKPPWPRYGMTQKRMRHGPICKRRYRKDSVLILRFEKR